MNWYKNKGNEGDIVLSTRVRLARNLSGIPFPSRMSNEQRANLKEKVKALIPILIPLLFSAVRRAAELADAMECRCYNSGEGKTRMKQLKLHFRDFSITAITLIFGAGVILFNIFM